MKLFAEFRLDTSNECLWQNGSRISLPPKPFAVLRYLVEHPGRLITHDELLDARGRKRTCSPRYCVPTSWN